MERLGWHIAMVYKGIKTLFWNATLPLQLEQIVRWRAMIGWYFQVYCNEV